MTRTLFKCWRCAHETDSYIDYLNHEKEHGMWPKDEGPPGPAARAQQQQEASARIDVTPAHYQGDTMQPFDVIDAFGLDFYLGNVIKYVCRAGKKGPALEDLRKAAHYITEAIRREEDR